MRRFVTLALLLVCSIPVGLSISGCSKGVGTQYCNGGDSGMQTGQVDTINLDPRLYGVSLNYGEIGSTSQPVATDCKGNVVSVRTYTWGTTNFNYVDVAPNGAICAGTWNRNTPGGVPDYTTCTAPTTPLPLPSTPAFTTPTAPTATNGSMAMLNYGAYSIGINGTIDISLAGGPTLTGTISGTNTPLQFATAFNAVPAFSSAGVVATYTSTSVTLTGPAGVNETISLAGTTLAGYAPAGFVTASGGGASSNTVPVFVHPTVDNVVLTPQTGCNSQGTVSTLTAHVFTGSNTDISAVTGPLYYSAQNATVVSINSTVLPPLATALQPGSTVLSASTSNSGSASSTGLFYTCPPKSITLSVPGVTGTNIIVNQNTPQALNATVVDTNNNPMTGLNLEYVSTTPQTVNAAGGSIQATYPGKGTITAICQPSSCNPAPLNEMGANGNGLPVTSNPLQVTTPGSVNTVLYMASTGSQYFTSMDFYTGQLISAVRLPYVPNSMMSDQPGSILYMGSTTELMEVNTTNNSVIKEDASVRGNVVGVAPNGSSLVISDPVHSIIYIYNGIAGSSSPQFGGIATHAAFSPDGQDIYITGSDSAGDVFFVYSVFSGWHTYTAAQLGFTPTNVAVTVPAIGAYMAGATTNAVSYCAVGVPPTNFFPSADSKPVATDWVAATNDSLHILGAAASTKLFTDLNLTLPSFGGPSNPGACPAAGFKFTTTPYSVALGVNPATITGVVPDTNSTVAFVTYTSNGTSPVLPAYQPAASGLGTLTPVALSGAATAPVAGIFSPDGLTFYTGTSGDNYVHTISTTTLTDTGTVKPALPLCQTQDQTGNCTALGTGSATPNLLAVKPRPTS